MNELEQYRESIEKAVRIGIARPSQAEKDAIERVLHMRISWNCSDCVFKAYRKALTIINIHRDKQATESNAEASTDTSKRGARKRK